MHDSAPLFLLTASALLCLLCIWIARQGRHLEPADYTELCKIGLPAYVVMFFIVIASQMHTTVLTVFTFLAVVCFTILFFLFITRTAGLNSSRFKRITVAGMVIYIATIPFLPWIMPGYMQ
ncbi:MAG: energy-converting hydrogenase Eha subunit G [Candidatus Paceibacteria bacterium]|jgi:energy-converting hydrogenase Eha subunit G